MKVEGRCHCGAIRFEATVDAARTSLCHCTDCQTLSGTAFRVSAAAAAETFHVLSGTPKEYIKIAASGARRIQAFCSDCGTALYAKAADVPGPVNIRAGTLRQRHQLRPVRQIWCCSALEWMPALENLESWEGEVGSRPHSAGGMGLKAHGGD